MKWKGRRSGGSESFSLLCLSLQLDDLRSNLDITLLPRRSGTMSAGLSQKFNILHQSPHDLQPPAMPEGPGEGGRSRWVSSRYTVRAATDDGRLVLWNSYNGAMSIIRPELKE